MAYRFGRGIKAGRVWTNCYHAYPAHAAFGGYKKSGIGRETHKMMLDHYQQTKNVLVSYSTKALGFLAISSTWARWAITSSRSTPRPARSSGIRRWLPRASAFSSPLRRWWSTAR
jgi:hypothetical protein